MFFTAEYICRIAVARRKLRFVFSVFGVIDLIAIIPFYLSLGVDLRSMRVFRLFRLIRIFRLSRYGIAVRRLRRTVAIAREDLTLFL